MADTIRSTKLLPEGIYGITAEKFSLGRANPEVVRAMIQGGKDHSVP